MEKRKYHGDGFSFQLRQLSSYYAVKYKMWEKHGKLHTENSHSKLGSLSEHAEIPSERKHEDEALSQTETSPKTSPKRDKNRSKSNTRSRSPDNLNSDLHRSPLSLEEFKK